MTKPALIGMGLALFNATFVQAQNGSFVGGNELYKWCTTPQAEGLCFSYIKGVSDLIDTFQETNKSAKAICVPNGVTISQMKDIVMKRLVQHPEIRHLSASSIVWTALVEVWPCR